MPYTLNGKTLRAGVGFTDADGIQHPPNWAKWSEAEKIAYGLVWVEPDAPYDNRFYWALGIPRASEDAAEVDEDGLPLLDEKGIQVITKGLKSNAIDVAKQQAAGLLRDTDWMVIRGVENGGKPVTSPVKDYRASVRTASDSIEASIVACTTLAQFMALYETPVDVDGKPTGNAPIGDWPEKVETP